MSKRASVRLDRLWKRRGLHTVKRVSRTNGAMRESLYAKMDRRLDRMRHGLKDLIADTLSLRRSRNTVPDCPKLRWK
jgi:hypothetical protein